jgi:hypothetical protein
VTLYAPLIFAAHIGHTCRITKDNVPCRYVGDRANHVNRIGYVATGGCKFFLQRYHTTRFACRSRTGSCFRCVRACAANYRTRQRSFGRRRSVQRMNHILQSHCNDIITLLGPHYTKRCTFLPVPCCALLGLGLRRPENLTNRSLVRLISSPQNS